MSSDLLSVPRRLIEATLRQAPAAMEPSIRASMESRFGADLGNVRIHAGPAAAALCEALQARAFTRGHDIVFGKGEYAPGDPEGLRLIAHELVHVMQQRAATRRTPSTPVPIGEHQCDLEREADRLGHEALGAGLISPITPDGTGALRRTLKVFAPTASMAVNHEGARPDISYTQRKNVPMAVLHLTKNSKPIVQGTPLRRVADAAAIRISGTVTVEAHTQDDWNPWKFHLIQVFMDVSNSAFYAGQSPSEGSMQFDFVSPGSPLYNRYALDADPDDDDNFPFVDKGKPKIERVGSLPNILTVTVGMTDHPNQDLPLTLPNFATGNKINYLCRVFRQFEVITVFVVRNLDTGRTFQPLAHVSWGAIWNQILPWTIRDGNPDAGPGRIIQGWFNVGQAAQGAPTDPRAAAMIADPPSDPEQTYNRLAKMQFATRVGSLANAGGVYASRDWSSFIPPEHFRGPSKTGSP